MRPKLDSRRAFTLVELLCVVTLIVCLVGILVPTLLKGYDHARFVSCQNNIRSLGSAGLGFAADHMGRGPGWAKSGPSGAPSSWADILNKAYFRQSQKIIRMLDSGTVTTGKIICPSLVLGTFPAHPRPFLWNSDALGGGGGIPPDPRFEGPYGKSADSEANSIDSSWTTYCLGAVLGNFPNPASQFLATEGECGVSATDPNEDVCSTGSPSNSAVTVNVTSPYPLWTALSGKFSFRHLLPSDPALYQTQGKAGFLFLDGHVDIFGPSDPINSTIRFAYKQ